MVVVYKWGGIAFDDYSLAKILFQPALCGLTFEATFHDEDGSNYQVPASHIFVAGYMSYKVETNADVGAIGESDVVDGTLTKTLLIRGQTTAQWEWLKVMAVFAAGKYVTGSSQNAAWRIEYNTVLYGVEIDIS